MFAIMLMIGAWQGVCVANDHALLFYLHHERGCSGILFVACAFCVGGLYAVLASVLGAHSTGPHLFSRSQAIHMHGQSCATGHVAFTYLW